MILVTGATGNVGSELVRALSEAGKQVRALTHSPTDASVVPPGVEVVTGDLNRAQSLTAALTGVDRIFLLPGYQDMPGMLTLARRTGVRQVVLLSGGSAALADLNNAVSRYMTLAEQAVRESGMPWTLLRPRAFMSNALRWRPQLAAGDAIRVPFADVPAAVIDPYDIAAVAAQALITDDHEGRIHELTGPQPLLPADQVAVLAYVLGRDLRCQGLTDAQAREEMSRTMPPEYVDAFIDFYAEGTLDESTVFPTVREVTGHEPRTFEQWARIHARAFH
ncbi:NmrA family NAD(P)-binding protein [Phytoactinopolyspora halotolerans]|uniref:NAD(P)H-binding protein n=1 Tax=Phytoactinopolyspora halotolerans TaxID=1981512 RepID=A0A6L9SGM9_9ACTN|nr:NAD(P)H-binding protein [Phytoactinopolyspora halotolerans]NEE03738.1 NAD(P)H-binding protein [Phytoactinopolyspora halotolerans]